MVNEIRVFEDDLAESNRPKIRLEWLKIINNIFSDIENLKFKDDPDAQLGYGVDAIVYTKRGRRYSLEFKTKRNTYFANNNYTFEIAHLRYWDQNRERFIKKLPGWLYKSMADYLIFATYNQEKTKFVEYMFCSLKPFKDLDFAPKLSDFRKVWAGPTLFKNGQYQYTINKLIPISFIRDNSMDFKYWRGLNV